MDAALRATGAWKPEELCIEPSRAAWAAYLDIYILAADGGLLDACLLASAASLRTLQLPSVEVNDQGNVCSS